jgi:DNA excision repair protein ERCC-2
MPVKINLAKKTVTLGVGDLASEPVLNVGRVAGLRQWTRLALGREVHEEHQRAQLARSATYAREFFVRHTTTVDDFEVKIQGRIDGVHPPQVDEPWIIEEVKSAVVSPLAFAAIQINSNPHHLEQLRLYCYFLEEEKKNVVGKLIYINVSDGARKEFATNGPFTECRQMIIDRVRAVISGAVEQERQRTQRRTCSVELKFPHEKPRPHQDQMIAAVEQALQQGRHLLVSAPSGIGKTAGALYPAIKYALAEDKRVFFVTAKNTQHQQAAETLRRLAGPTAVVVRARESMCINSVYACREEFCPHLQMFQLKLQQTQIIDRLLQKHVLTPDMLMEAGLGTSLCPFELALLEAERTDAIVCDYNYVFDPQVYFRRFFQDEDYSNAILIIDEAHNLVQRALEYYSPVLRRRQIHELSRQLSHVEPLLAKELRQFLRNLDEFFRTQVYRVPDEYSQVEEEQAGRGQQFLIDSPKPFFDSLRPTLNRLSLRYMLDKIESGRAIPDDPAEDFFSELGKFYSVLGMEGDEFSCLYDMTGGESLKIVCKDASQLLAERLKGFHSVIAMSATLEPMEFYERMLGFDSERTDRLKLPSPFPAENREIFVIPNVSTTYRKRGGNYEQIAEIITTTAGAHAGNYMALFPSYEFMRATAQHLTSDRWQIHVQEPGMDDAQRQTVLDALKTTTPPKLVLAVQGGIFAEGVDYPGETLSGVIVVSPALPQVSFERELMRQYYQQHYGKGFEFAYLYPGMNRVIQSVGRLIRTETDCGVAVLVCQRFALDQYSTLFPADWSNEGKRGLICRDLHKGLTAFWLGISARPKLEKTFTSEP